MKKALLILTIPMITGCASIQEHLKSLELKDNCLTLETSSLVYDIDLLSRALGVNIPGVNCLKVIPTILPKEIDKNVPETKGE